MVNGLINSIPSFLPSSVSTDIRFVFSPLRSLLPDSLAIGFESEIFIIPGVNKPSLELDSDSSMLCLNRELLLKIDSLSSDSVTSNEFFLTALVDDVFTTVIVGLPSVN